MWTRSPGMRSFLAMDDDRLALLTPKERECLALLPLRTSKEIAREMQISPRTVEQHLASARRKLGATSSLEAARFLQQHPENLLKYPIRMGEAPPADAPLLREDRAVYEPMSRSDHLTENRVALEPAERLVTMGRHLITIVAALGLMLMVAVLLSKLALHQLH